MTRQTPTPKTLLLVDGRKGGTGKSMCAMAAFEFLRGVPGLRAYDFDGDFGDMATRYGAIAVNPDPRGKLDSFGVVLEDLIEGDVNVAIVDIGAHAGVLIDDFLINGGPVDFALDGHLQIGSLWVTDAHPRSLSHLDQALKKWDRARAPIKTAIVKNEGRAQHFELLEEHAEGKRLCSRAVAVTSLPELEEASALEVRAIGTEFHRYIGMQMHAGAKVPLMRRAGVRAWLRKCDEQFATVPFLAELAAGVPAGAGNRPSPIPPAVPARAA